MRRSDASGSDSPEWGTEWSSAERLSSTARLDGPSPVALSMPFAPSPVAATDGRNDLTFEVHVTNTAAVPLVVQRVQIGSADGADSDLANYEGGSVAANMNLVGDNATPTDRLQPAQLGFFFVDVAMDEATPVPAGMKATVSVRALETPPPDQPIPGLAGMVDESGGPVPATLDTSVTVQVFDGTVPVIGPPLRGDGCAAMEGCCADNTHHRRGVWSVDGRLLNFERYAIDFLGVDREGFAYRGDNTKENYVGCRADVIAVADAEVVSVLDGQEENVIGEPQPERNLTEATGNHIVLDLGNGVYAFYGHFVPGSISVKEGDHVEKGAVVGQLGNSGQSTAPHLHFHLMDNTNPALAESVPFEFDAFDLAGHATLEDVTYLPTPEPRTDEMPLSQTVVDFAGE
ncbi:M23 family metallopeptidase [Rhodococcus sp. IEGM 1351]|uniref:M23 family metallopeptidase n=1 Tax=Rhodococcus sp. IEGM 1351 TaxID=3047089 RepID=UPI0024B7E118|nr:M23 family metallopeptidase [Rhodococcus sp. IEGM 1351]